MFRHNLIAVHYVPNGRRPCANCLEYKLDKYASVYGHRDIEVQWLWVREWRTTRKRARFNGQKGLKWILTLPPTKISLMSTTESLPDRVASKTLRYAVSNVHCMSCWQAVQEDLWLQRIYPWPHGWQRNFHNWEVPTSSTTTWTKNVRFGCQAVLNFGLIQYLFQPDEERFLMESQPKQTHSVLS